MEIRNEKLIIRDYVMGNEEAVIEAFEKAKKWDDLKANFEKDGDV